MIKNEAMQTVLTGVPIPLVLVAADEHVQILNPEAEKLLGYGLSGRHYISVLRQPILLDCVEAVLRDAAPGETRYISNEAGRETTYLVTCAPVTLDTPGTGAIISFNDVTLREEAGQMRRDFVANVSHELRTPLTALLGFIETLSGTAKDDAAARTRFLEIMETEATRMNRLVGDLLSLSRVESEERIRPNDMVDVVVLVRSAVQSLSALALAENVQIVVKVDDSSMKAPGDSDQLLQVFTNLIENAIKYGGRNKTVEVNLSISTNENSLRGPGVRVEVIDHGSGIDPQHLPRLTERFYRVDSHRSREMGGTGLGLAIVKHIINRHRGRLRISSATGEGSKFSVVLPIRKA